MSVSEFVWTLSSAAASPLASSVVALGAFDGIHRGHQTLIQRATSEAKRLGVPSVVVIFEPQPNEYFSKEHAPARLMRLREKVVAIQALNVDRIFCLKFDQALRRFSPIHFVEKVLVEYLGTKFIVVGDDFRFGADGAGNYAFLQSQAKEHGFVVTDTDSFKMDGERVSSTLIRGLLAQAKFGEAAEMLGRPYRNLGRVSYGEQVGRTIGVPTMNIALGRKVAPFTGVFAVKAEIEGKTYNAVANVGVRPTINTLKKPKLEVHVLGETIDAYGKFVWVEYVAKIRDERKFDSIDELKAQIKKDIADAEAIFSGSGS